MRCRAGLLRDGDAAAGGAHTLLHRARHGRAIVCAAAAFSFGEGFAELVLSNRKKLDDDDDWRLDTGATAVAACACIVGRVLARRRATTAAGLGLDVPLPSRRGSTARVRTTGGSGGGGGGGGGGGPDRASGMHSGSRAASRGPAISRGDHAGGGNPDGAEREAHKLFLIVAVCVAARAAALPPLPPRADACTRHTAGPRITRARSALRQWTPRACRS